MHSIIFLLITAVQSLVKRDVIGTCDYAMAATSSLELGMKKHMQEGWNYNKLVKKLDSMLTEFPANIADHNDKITDPSDIFRYGFYNAYAYCQNQSFIQQMSAQKVNNQPIYTGNFNVFSYRPMIGYSTLFKNDKDILFYVAVQESPKRIVATFRGSHNFQNWMADISLKTVKRDALKSKSLFSSNGNDKCSLDNDLSAFTDGKDFYGFEGFVDSLNYELLETLATDLKNAMVQYPNYPIVITGHSLGAALAMLSSAYISGHHPEIPLTKVYTFGQPVLGSTAFNNFVASCIGTEKIARVVSYNDVVPWGHYKEGVNEHASNVLEVFNVYPDTASFNFCRGPNDQRCSAMFTCDERRWRFHGQLSGLPISHSLCILAEGPGGPDESNDGADFNPNFGIVKFGLKSVIERQAEHAGNFVGKVYHKLFKW